MNQLEYCTKICGGKCCVLHLEDEGSIPCPRLNADKSCSVYKERYAEGAPDLVVVGYWKSRKYKTLDGDDAVRPFWCGHIKKLPMSPELKEKCCVFHPELLNENLS